MKVELLAPDTAPLPDGASPDPSVFGRALGATKAEDVYADGGGSLQDAMYRRAQADIALSVATAAAQRAAQAVQTLLNLQI
jgi:hypothetical protein